MFNHEDDFNCDFFSLPPADCGVEFTHAFHWEQKHNFAGTGISDSATRLVRVRIGAVVRSINIV